MNTSENSEKERRADRRLCKHIGLKRTTGKTALEGPGMENPQAERRTTDMERQGQLNRPPHGTNRLNRPCKGKSNNVFM